MNKVHIIWYTTLWLSMVGLLMLLWSDVLGEDSRDDTVQNIFKMSRRSSQLHATTTLAEVAETLNISRRF